MCSPRRATTVASQEDLRTCEARRQCLEYALTHSVPASGRHLRPRTSADAQREARPAHPVQRPPRSPERHHPPARRPRHAVPARSPSSRMHRTHRPPRPQGAA
ncbi:hypothetical protein CP979_36075 [Streptomyces filamentosus]|nr:hypothetical protein CP979_36075 [Streptomyces filamentosus]